MRKSVRSSRSSSNRASNLPSTFVTPRVSIDPEYQKEIQTYQKFARHANILQLLHQYKMLANSTVSPSILSAWLWHSFRGTKGETGFPEGEGTVYLGVSTYYTGGFRKGLFHGRGTLKWGDDLAYDGNFFCNCLHGSGSYHWPGRAHYDGEVLDGYPSGQGKMEEGKRGHTYEGKWKSGLRHGQGLLNYKEDGSVYYMGDWDHDKKHGKGQYVYATSTTYQGSWVEGQRQGMGTQVQFVNSKTPIPITPTIFANVYEGEWVAGLPHGRGKSLWTWDHNKETVGLLHNAYIGTYDSGMRSGKGTFYYASGAIFQGTWKKNLKDGVGLFTYEDGRLCSGYYKDNHFEAYNDGSISILIKEALDNVVKDEVDIETTKLKLSNVLMRYIAILKNLFHDYSAYNTNASKPVKQDVPDSASIEDRQHPPEQQNNPTISTILTKGTLDVGLLRGQEDKPFTENQISKKYLDQLSKYISDTKPESDPMKELNADNTMDQDLGYANQALRLEGQTYAMPLDNFWRFCYDAHVVEPGLGLAQIDAILLPASNAWDDVFDLYCPTRQLIQREVNETMIKLGLCKFYAHSTQPDLKLLKIFEEYANSTSLKDVESIYKTLTDEITQEVLRKHKVNFEKIFCTSLLQSRTQYFCIKLQQMKALFESVLAGPDIPQQFILRFMLKTLYQFEFGGENEKIYLDMEINYREFEILMVQFSTMDDVAKKQLDDATLKESSRIVCTFINDIHLLKAVPQIQVEEPIIQA